MKNMKKLLSIILSFILVLSVAPTASASEQGTVVSRQKIELEDGIVIIDTLVEYTNARVWGKTATRLHEVYADGILIGSIVLLGSFNYDGTTVTVTSMAVTQKDTYEGWRYVQNSLTSSGGTVTLNAKLTKLFSLNIPFTISITCDANGNLS